MLFNSWVFLPFLLTVLLLYRFLPHRAQNLMLLIASYFFYACWDWRFLGLLIVSTTCDWMLARAISRESTLDRARKWVVCSVIINLVFLGFFKYFNFFIDSANDAVRAIGFPGWSFGLSIILPVGISFYTFQSISYIVDVYRREIEPAKNPIDFALFVAFFPHMVAGPIMPSRQLLPQLQRERYTTRAQTRAGLWLMLLGFFKKVVIGDNLAPIADNVFGSPAVASGAVVLVGVYAFALQIYCDFSGYTDIARGVAKLLGIELMVNFDRPYIAKNPSDFWRRWHISLSQWLRDYLYISLGGSRGGRFQTYRNLLLTMVLGGLWHGAAWNFVLWGIYHGLLLVVHRAATVDLGLLKHESRLSAALSRVLMFHAVCYGWLLFRANSFAQIRNFTLVLASGWLDVFSAVSVGSAIVVGLGAAILWSLESWSVRPDEPELNAGWNLGGGALVSSLMFVAIVLMAPPTAQTFIYFQF
jgi:alginate O-acetyltransferase complex protein AlgI